MDRRGNEMTILELLVFAQAKEASASLHAILPSLHNPRFAMSSLADDILADVKV